jgi:hypothetical protein
MSLGVSMASGAKVQFGTPEKLFHASMAAKLSDKLLARGGSDNVGERRGRR